MIVMSISCFTIVILVYFNLLSSIFLIGGTKWNTP